MAPAIGPGDWVECVDAQFHASAGVALVLAAIYRVREVLPDAILSGGGRGPTVRLRNIALPIGPHGVEASWAISRFRPIYRPKQEIIEALKAPPIKAQPRVREPALLGLGRG